MMRASSAEITSHGTASLACTGSARRTANHPANATFTQRPPSPDRGQVLRYCVGAPFVGWWAPWLQAAGRYYSAAEWPWLCCTLNWHPRDGPNFDRTWSVVGGPVRL